MWNVCLVYTWLQIQMTVVVIQLHVPSYLKQMTVSFTIPPTPNVLLLCVYECELHHRRHSISKVANEVE